MPKTKTALEFVFDAQAMMRICQGKGKILITSYLEKSKDINGKEIGVMRVKAVAKGKPKATAKTLMASASTTIDGCPVPPCGGA